MKFCHTVYNSAAAVLVLLLGLAAGASAQLVCEVRGPDTIRYIGDRYVPEVFSVDTKITNIGDSAARNVKVFTLQDNGFISAPNTAPILSWPDIPPNFTYDFGNFDALQFSTVPRNGNRLDTITFLIVADDLPPAVCMHVLYVEGVKRPLLQIVCIPDARLPMVFDEGLNDYTPNPFTMTTTVTNTGTAPIYDGEIRMHLSNGIEPYGQNSIQPMLLPSGALMPGDTYTFTWQLMAKLQPAATTQDVTFQVWGTCCGDGRWVTAECRTPIFIPPVRKAQYEILCSAPDNITYDPSSSSYVPDPFAFTVTIRNTGTAEGHGIRMKPSLPSRLYLASGQYDEQYIPTLPIGQSVTLTWLLRPVAESFESNISLCVSIVDTFGATASCCANVVIPPATEPNLSLFCEPEYSELSIDTLIGDYLPENPFEVYLTITNNSPNPVYNVEAELVTGSSGALILDNPVAKPLAAVLNPGFVIGPIAWVAKVKPRTQSGDIHFTFRVTSSNTPPKVCGVVMSVPEMGRPVLDCSLTRVVNGVDDHILNWDPTTGEYEGQSHQDGYKYFTMRVTVLNVGTWVAENVQVRIAPLNGGCTLLDGETPTKAFEEGSHIVVGGAGHASWKFIPIRHGQTGTFRFEVTVTADNAEISRCIYEMQIEGGYRVVEVAIPDDLQGTQERNILVPINFPKPPGTHIYAYQFNVRFDPQRLQFIDALNQNTLAGSNWNGAKTELLHSPGSSVPDVVRVHDAVMFPPAITGNGTIVYLRFKVLDMPSGSGNVSTPLVFIDTLFDAGKVYFSSIFNYISQGGPGDDALRLATTDGSVLIAGDAMPGPIPADAFEIDGNSPNPFNPATQIHYTLGKAAHIRIDVFDMLGRRVETLVEGTKLPGRHVAAFDANGLPSGSYHCVMTSEGRSRVLRMVLSQ